MPPAKVLVMRHAEKLGDPDDPNLPVPGQARALFLSLGTPRLLDDQTLCSPPRFRSTASARFRRCNLWLRVWEYHLTRLFRIRTTARSPSSSLSAASQSWSVGTTAISRVSCAA